MNQNTITINLTEKEYAILCGLVNKADIKVSEITSVWPVLSKINAAAEGSNDDKEEQN
jgi:hypothetical protein